MQDLSELLERISSLVDSINRLAESNQALIQAMISADDEDHEPDIYLDGTNAL